MKNEQNDGFFDVCYIILTELYANIKHNKKTDPRAINSDRFDISAGYLAEILYYLHEKGYVTGLNAFVSEAGTKIIQLLDETKITPAGIYYLEEDSAMKRCREKYKDQINPSSGVK